MGGQVNWEKNQKKASHISQGEKYQEGVNCVPSCSEGSRAKMGNRYLDMASGFLGWMSKHTEQAWRAAEAVHKGGLGASGWMNFISSVQSEMGLSPGNSLPMASLGKNRRL